MNKHAFLILAHSEFEILQALISAIDDSRHDIYLHIDKKVKELPIIHTYNSQLFILDNRINVCWGDVSVVEAEYRLFEESYKNGPYDYYHLISGVDMPIVRMDDFHEFFNNNKGKEFIGFSTYDYSQEVKRKINYVHLFAKDFRKNGLPLNTLKGLVRAIFLRFQMLLGIERNRNIEFKKGTQWVSITNDFVSLLCLNKQRVLKIYKNSFCSDEIYKQTICWNSEFREKIYCLDNEAIGSMRMIGWVNKMLVDWKNFDFDKLITSNKLFARKFNTANIDVVNRILKFITL